MTTINRAESGADRPTTVSLSHLALSVGSLRSSEAFYRDVFGFEVSSAPYRGSGHRLTRLMGVPDCTISGVFLRKGDFFLELLEYNPAGRARPLPYRDDEPGFAHLSFVVADLTVVGRAVDTHGGATQWATEVEMSFGAGKPVAIVFCTDPDGNRIELVEHRDAIGRDRHAAFLGAGELGWPIAAPPADSNPGAEEPWS